MTIEVLSAVIDNQKFLEHGFHYLEENSHKICVDSGNFLDKVKLKIQRLLQHKVIFNNEALPPLLEEEDDSMADHIIKMSDAIEASIKVENKEVKPLKKIKRVKNIEDSIGFDIGQTMLRACTRTDYNKIR